MNEQKEKTANQQIHEWLGKCWHDDTSQDSSPFACGKCDEPRHWKPNKAYDQDLNAVAEVEAKVIETFGRKEYYDSLLDIAVGTWEVYELPMDLAFADAKTRTAAIVSLIEEKENG